MGGLECETCRTLHYSTVVPQCKLPCVIFPLHASPQSHGSASHHVLQQTKSLPSSLTAFFKTDIANWINGYKIKSRSGLGTSLPLARLKPDKFTGIVVYIVWNIEKKGTNRACWMAIRLQLLRQLLHLLGHIQSFPLSLFVCFLVRILLRYISLDIFVSKLL